MFAKKATLFFGFLLASFSLSAGVNDFLVTLILSVAKMAPFWGLISLPFIFICCVPIEAYVAHYILKISYAKSLRIMLLVKALQMFAAYLIRAGLLESYLHPYNNLKDQWVYLWDYFKIGMSFVIIIFIIQLTIAYMFFYWLNPSMSKKQMLRAMVYAQIVGLITFIFFDIVRDERHYRYMLEFDRQKTERQLQDYDISSIEIE